MPSVAMYVAGIFAGTALIAWMPYDNSALVSGVYCLTALQWFWIGLRRGRRACDERIESMQARVDAMHADLDRLESERKKKGSNG